MVSAFCDITGRHLSIEDMQSQSAAEIKLSGFEGFLLSETDISKRVAASKYSEILRIMSLSFGFKLESSQVRKAKSGLRTAESISHYALCAKDQDKRKYYEGWFLNTKGKTRVFIDLSRFYIQFGRNHAEILVTQINTKLSKYSHFSGTGYTACIRAIIKQLCREFKTPLQLKMLHQPPKVNDFAEKCFSHGLLRTIALDNDIETYYQTWKKTATIFEKVFCNSYFAAEPAYAIFAPHFSTSIYESRKKYDNTFTPIPLQIKDDEALAKLRQTLVENKNDIIKACRQSTYHELRRYYSAKKLAKNGKPLTSISDQKIRPYYNMADLCATWNSAPYESQDIIFSSKYGSETLLKSIYTLRADTLLPLIYHLAILNPQITPSWLIDLKLYNKKGQMTGFTQSGKTYKAKSRKKRANKEQIITLDKQSVRIFKRIIMLTKDARSYLRDQGSDDWRCLLFTSDKGMTYPTRMNAIPSIRQLTEQHQFRNELLKLEKLRKSKNRPIETKSLTIKRMRADQLVIRYLDTLSREEFAKAAGHSKHSSKLIYTYIPLQIRHFLLDRWLRQFQNAILYDIMKDSPHLLQSVDFNSQQELDAFLKNIRPDYDFHMDGNPATIESVSSDIRKSDKIYIALNRSKLLILLSIYELVKEAITLSKIIPEVILQWYRVACLVVTAKSLANEGKMSGICSQGAIYLLRSTEHSLELSNRLRGLIYGSQSA
ncbi:hypothetical protein ACIQAL_03810 [Pseudomonas sp. NPDC088368]|uniref:hypothetical protein n=1 Tax=Pseudomonas sp. NPDC088368 TaxID=3364453 RepID=UPI00381947C3